LRVSLSPSLPPQVDRASRDAALATVTLGLPHLDGRLFTDQLFMLRVRGAWTIVSKTWTLHAAPVVILPLA